MDGQHANEHPVVVAGHIALDVTPRFPEGLNTSPGELLKPGKLINVGDAVLSIGGPVCNTGIAFIKMGIQDVELIAKVGCDVFGRAVVDLVSQHTDPRGVRMVAGEATSYSVVLALPGIDRIFLHNPGANDTFCAADIDWSLVREADLFHLGYPPLMRALYSRDGTELADIFMKAKETGATTSLDMALPDANSESGKVNWARILERALPYVDIFVPSIEEICFMLDREYYEAVAERAGSNDPVFFFGVEQFSKLANDILDLGVKILLIKGGARGLYLRTGPESVMNCMGRAGVGDPAVWSQRELWSPTFVAHKFASATGSGDATIAGFLSAFLRGLTPQESLACGNAAGWQNVQELDTLSGLKGWASALAMASDTSMERNPAGIEADGWRFSEKDQLYFAPADASS